MQMKADGTACGEGVCASGQCAPEADGGTDGGPEAGADAASEGGQDGSLEAGKDSGMDATPDAPVDGPQGTGGAAGSAGAGGADGSADSGGSAGSAEVDAQVSTQEGGVVEDDFKEYEYLQGRSCGCRIEDTRAGSGWWLGSLATMLRRRGN